MDLLSLITPLPVWSSRLANTRGRQNPYSFRRRRITAKPSFPAEFRILAKWDLAAGRYDGTDVTRIVLMWGERFYRDSSASKEESNFSSSETRPDWGGRGGVTNLISELIQNPQYLSNHLKKKTGITAGWRGFGENFQKMDFLEI